MTKLNHAQIIVMLEYFGIPCNQQSNLATERKALLKALENSEPEKYEAAHNLVVLKKLPDAANVQQITAAEIGSRIDAIVEVSTENAQKYVRNVTLLELSKLTSKHTEQILELSNFAKDAIAKEAMEFRTIAVSVNSSDPKPLDFVAPKEFNSILQLAAQRKNILLVGPAGCGKTFIASKVAEGLGLDYAAQSCTAGISESLLSGWLLPTGENGRFEYVQSEFVRIYENGGIFLFDEIDASDPNVLIFINQAIANNHFFLPQRYSKPLIRMHKDFVAIAAANTFGNGADMQYVGRNQLDAATLDRFKVGTVAMDYDEKVETRLIDEEILLWGWKIRKSISDSHLTRILSTRVMIDASDMKLGQGWTIGDINRAYFSDWSPEEKRMLGVQR